jgi:putative ABC transport system permease protein
MDFAMPHELRYAFRTLKNNPSFASIAILTLALGIGANTAMFTVVNGVLLRPLDYPNASRIVQLNTSFAKEGRSIPRTTGPDLIDIRSGASTLDQIAYYWGGEMGVQMTDHAEFVATYLVASNYFSVFGVAPAYGRAFYDRPSEGRIVEENDANQSAVVSLAFAQRNFGSGAGALGKTLQVEGVSHAIVGVMPATFHFPQDANVWLALTPSPEGHWSERTAFNYQAWLCFAPVPRSMRPMRSCALLARGSKRPIPTPTRAGHISRSRSWSSLSAPCAPRSTS